MKFLMIIFIFSFYMKFTPGESVKTNCRTPRAMKFETVKQEENSTCPSVVIQGEICDNSSGSPKWKFICLSNWTLQAATVICRQMNYSDIGANISEINFNLNGRRSSIVPVCSGSEGTILDCNTTTVATSDNCKIAGSICFPDNEECFAGTLTEPTSPAVHITSRATTSSELVTTDQTSFPTNGSQIVDFWLSPPGLGVIIAVIVIVILLFTITIIFLAILMKVCKAPHGNNGEPARVSPQNCDFDNSLKDTNHPVFNNTPEQDRHPSPSDSHPEHHYIDHHGPIYEHVKDVPSPSASMSSQESNKSGTDTSDGLPTYATLEESANTYAQVKPYIHRSLTRDVSGDTEIYSHYRSLNRTTSQGSNVLPNREPRSQALACADSMQPFSSDYPPSRGHSVLAPCASNTELPVYSILESRSDIGDDEASEFSNSAVLGHKLPGYNGQHVGEVPRQQWLHNASRLAKPDPHERMTPTLKASTLPNQGRSAPSRPSTGTLPAHRGSGGLDTRDLPKQATYSNATGQDIVDTNTWV